MKQRKLQLEEIELPKISEEDIMKTIHHSKAIIQQLPVTKKESSSFQSLKQIILFHGWRSLFIQGALVFFLIIMAWIAFPIVDESISIVFVMLASITLSVAISYELYRVELFQMKELEYSCVYSPQRMFVWKILILSMISLIGIIVVCIYVANAYERNLLTLIYGGSIPFILLNGTALHLTQHQNTFNVFLLLCSLFILFSSNVGMLYMQAIEERGLLYLVLAILYYIGMNVWTYRKKLVL